MLEYCEKASTEAPSEPMQTGRGEIPRYMSLAEQYGLGDDMNIGESNETEQTVEQEYQAYVTATLSPSSVNILKFWEVNHFYLRVYQY